MDNAAGTVLTGTSRLIFMVCLFIILALCLLYIYRWLNGSGELNDVTLLQGVKPMNAYNTTDGPLVLLNGMKGVPDIPPLLGGGEYSVSAWIYITDWAIRGGTNKRVLTLSGGGGTYETLVIYLGGQVNKLGVRTSTSKTKLNQSQLAKIDGYLTPYTDVDVDFLKCDIESVAIQRWVNVTVVLNGTVVDVYMDGKLSRSCVLDSLFMVDGVKTTVKLGGDKGFGGLIGAVYAANFAYSPDQVYKKYQNGPFNLTWFSSLMKIFDPSQWNLDIKLSKTNTR